jgi:hypothetical protein
MKMPLNFFKLPKKKKIGLKVEDEGEEKPKGEFSLRLEEMIFFFFFQTPESRYCFTTPQFGLTRKKKGSKERRGRGRE